MYYYANDSVLAVGEESHASLLQTYLYGHVDDWNDVVGDTYDILVLSQGVQTAGLDSAEEACNKTFGTVNAQNCTNWFANAA